MALVKCRECGTEVSTKAVACPKCGAVQKAKTSGCTGCLGLGIFFFFVLAYLNFSYDFKADTLEQAKRAETVRVAQEGDAVVVGYTGYVVSRSWWATRITDSETLNVPPAARYLFVEVTVMNNDKEARMIPPFKLLDGNGAQFDSSSNAWAAEGSLGVLESLNPEVAKKGLVIFDVPMGREYKLLLSGGYWSPEVAHVVLHPK